MYSAPAVTDEVAKATHLVDDLFDYYVAHTGEVPQEYRAISEGDDLRAVTDFIAGMTDRYAKNLYQRLFIPQRAALLGSLGLRTFLRCAGAQELYNRLTMLSGDHIRQSFSAALPIMLGYVAIGIPCGILSASIGMNELQVFLLSAVFYSGAGQFMIEHVAGRLAARVHHRQRVAGEHTPDAVLGLVRAALRACEETPRVSVRGYGDRRKLRCEHGEVRGGRLVGWPRHAREPFLAKLVGAVERGGVLVGNAWASRWP